jgi:nicotinamide-nucleotide amidase
VEGCSHGFDRGFVTYTDDAKHEVLGVSREILSRDGAVSPAAAIAMTAGALGSSKGALALSITGFAGPGGPGDEPGLVYFALGWRNGLISVTEQRFGDVSRAAVRIGCLEIATDLLMRAMKGRRT